MDPNWNADQPIYRQLRDKIVAMILEGTLRHGEPLPSVRTVAAEHSINPLTVLKGYQQLVDEGLVEKRRGRGMFVTPSAHQQLLRTERTRFLDHEWPRVLKRISQLDLSLDDLLPAERNRGGE
jgi:GntR family transcriptional regulator